jgi:hypothetical protein
MSEKYKTTNDKKIVTRNVSICTKPNLKVPLLQLSAYWDELFQEFENCCL